MTKALDNETVVTVAQLKAIIKDWPELDLNGEPSEVWVATGKNLSSPVCSVSALNHRKNSTGESADVILEPADGFWERN